MLWLASKDVVSCMFVFVSLPEYGCLSVIIKIVLKSFLRIEAIGVIILHPTIFVWP